jgi:hypothetical protein
LAVAIKRNTIQKLEQGFHSACTDINPALKYSLYTGAEFTASQRIWNRFRLLNVRNW